MPSTNIPLLTSNSFTSGIKLLPQKLTSLLHNKWPDLLTAALVVLLCWQLAHWTWVFIAPAPSAPAQPSPSLNPENILETVRAAHLFGTANGNKPSETQSLTPLNLKLSGVFALTGKRPALAIINVDQKGDLPFQVGDSVLPEVRLEQVNPDHVVLRRSGKLEKLLLEQKGLPPDARNTAIQMNVHKSGNNRFDISRQEMDKVLSDPGQLAQAGRFKSVPKQGVRIEEAAPGSLMSKLGLQDGDIIRQVNGKPVEQSAELLQDYRHEGHVRVEGTRNGQTFEYNYIVH